MEIATVYVCRWCGTIYDKFKPKCPVCGATLQKRVIKRAIP
jgi:rubrerythrin